MESERDIVTRIQERFQKMSKGQKKVASFLLEHADQAAFMTAARLGEQLGVSESTVVRFAAAIGYGGDPGMQAALAFWVKGRLQAAGSFGAGSGQPEAAAGIFGYDMENIRYTAEHLDETSFHMAADILLDSRTVYIVGIRSCAPLAELLCFYLNMIRENNVLIRTSSLSEVFEQMLRVGQEDAVVGISFPRYSMRTLKAMEFANDRNAKVITITDSVHSPMSLYSSCNLIARSGRFSIVDSLTAPVSLINALIVFLCRKRPETVRKGLEELEEAWSNYQIYMNDEIDRIDEEAPFWLPEDNGKAGRKGLTEERKRT